MDYQYPDNLPQNDSHVEKNDADISNSTHQKRQNIVIVSTNILAVIGVIFLFSLGAWGTIKLTGISPQSLVAAVSNITSIFVPAKNEPVTFNLKTHNVEVGTPFVLTWAHKTSQSGTYAFQYECREDISVETLNTDGVVQEITCDSPFSLEKKDNSIILNFFSSQDRFVDLPITVMFVSKNSTEATQQGSTILTLINKKIQGEGSSLQEKSTTKAGSVSRGVKTNETRLINTKNNVASNPLGTPDLKVRVLATGIVDKVTNDFTPSTAIKKDERTAIRFEVRNIGTKESGPWTFIIDLPLTSGTYVFRPDNKQRSLKPGERVEYTLGFDSIDRTNNEAKTVINVDTERIVPEKNRTNNVDTAVIEFSQK